MSRHERALSYAKRIKTTSNLSEEARNILNEVDGLVYSEDNSPLALSEKIEIIRETKRILLQGETEAGRIIVEASDNSGIIDVIDGIENDLNKRNS